MRPAIRILQPDFAGYLGRSKKPDDKTAMLPSEIIIIALFANGPDIPESDADVAVDIPQLIRNAQHGDSNAVSTLYQIYAARIYRYVVYRVPTIADAEDLTADVFVRMVEGLPNYQITGAPFEAWLYRIASTRVADYFRKSGRHPQTELLESMPNNDMLPEEHVNRNQEFERLRGALSQLSEEHQTILILRFVERKSHDEVAQLLGKSPTAVKSAQHRALSQISTLLGQKEKQRHYLRGDHDAKSI